MLRRRSRNAYAIDSTPQVDLIEKLKLSRHVDKEVETDLGATKAWIAVGERQMVGSLLRLDRRMPILKDIVLCHLMWFHILVSDNLSPRRK